MDLSVMLDFGLQQFKWSCI